MSVKPFSITAVALTALCACEVQDNAGTTLPGRTCGAERLDHLVGMKASEVTFDTAGPVRILPPNSVATTDFAPLRLNVKTDANGTITSMHCG